MATATAPTFHVTHDTIAGNATDPITTVKNNTWVTATATITAIRHYGTGSSQRAHLALTADNGTMTGATISANRFPRLADALVLANGSRVQVRGLVRHTPSLPTVLEVTGIAPAA